MNTVNRLCNVFSLSLIGMWLMLPLQLSTACPYDCKQLYYVLPGTTTCYHYSPATAPADKVYAPTVNTMPRIATGLTFGIHQVTTGCIDPCAGDDNFKVHEAIPVGNPQITDVIDTAPQYVCTVGAGPTMP